MKTFIIDVDGTLASQSRDAVAPIDLAAIQEEKKKGNRVIICTGRSIYETRHILESINHDDILVSTNGGLSVKGDVLYAHKYMDSEQSAAILQVVNTEKMNGYVISSEVSNGKFTEYFDDAKTFQRRKNSEFVELTVYAKTKEQKDGWIEILKKNVGDKLVVKNSGETIIEIVSKNVNKGNSLKELDDKKLLGDFLVYIGDSENDLQAFDFVQKKKGVAVAMGNAFEEVKKKADYVTDDVDHGGVAKAIEWVNTNYPKQNM
ncbi:hypothetical protein EIN_155460 [Entamoeba invadens IP1]|uniref:Uncharacterized protein n=2 Tax=Entamoeba invadens TaxID=33085 RepID=A0A0A1U961_ENTIV|nr:hypothetical protein EIN_155460 [Entamoeba invadens IP1]ELP91439.1 hypothetical protein EIN_155460 [Entamoeba invadens IP1]BAN42420.1 hypothetical protein, conserved [Entamoeba invadens]|eukprot:XP_004258210.1 hypothetical protein EIN_155460 [Entamoeba invadens IP1]